MPSFLTVIVAMLEPALSEDVNTLVQWVRQSASGCAFTGAGISTESGIPDFRSPGGVWSKNRTVYFDDFCRSGEERKEYWRQKSIAHADFARARPNVTHQTLALLEQHHDFRGVITQNIDGLHQTAGSKSVLELHGTAREVACLKCEWREPADNWVAAFLATDVVPACPRCGGLIKHATISFGQSLEESTLQQAAEWSAEADLYLALGSSLVVEPAASLPRLAKSRGARLVIINRDETPLDPLADLNIRAPLGVVFTALLEQLSA
ncbi:MAG: Sir2 family NAD-dependent protein deacetylase [Planctomycetaceae bacterium]|nr:Sir2 family NAD-dependent protein deacetylase [Planctomycetaceae bacterium]